MRQLYIVPDCPGATDLLPEDWATLRYPYLEDNTIYYLRDGKVQQNVFARREDAEKRLKEMKEGIDDLQKQ